MPDSEPDYRFIFNGSAVAFGGRIRRPDDLYLKAVAASHLPVTGGLSEAKVEGPDVSQYHYKEYFKFSQAHSRASGDFTDPKKAADYTHGKHGENQLPASTMVEASLHDLRIDAEADHAEKTPRYIFQAKKLELRLQTTVGSDRQQTKIHSLATTLDGITLATVNDGVSVEAELKVHTATQIFCEYNTKAKLIEKYAKDSDFRKTYAACFHPLGEAQKGFLSNMVGSHEPPYASLGPIVATFVTELEWVGGKQPEGTSILGNRLTIPGLGKIYFGEIIINDHSQRTTLLRFELGSIVGGEFSVLDASSNGVRWPPHT